MTVQGCLFPRRFLVFSHEVSQRPPILRALTTTCAGNSFVRRRDVHRPSIHDQNKQKGPRSCLERAAFSRSTRYIAMRWRGLHFGGSFQTRPNCIDLDRHFPEVGFQTWIDMVMFITRDLTSPTTISPPDACGPPVATDRTGEFWGRRVQ